MTEAEHNVMMAAGDQSDQQQPPIDEQQPVVAAESDEQQQQQQQQHSHYENDQQQQQQPNSVSEEQSAAVAPAADSNAQSADGDKLAVDEQQQQQEAGAEVSQEPEQLRKVFVGGINYRTSEDTLKKHFGQFGSIVECVIMRDPGGRSRGFAFVTYTNGEMVDAVMKSRPHVIDGRDLDVKRATPKEDAGKPGFQLSVRKLFIGSVREGITEEDLRQYFGKYGNVTDCVVMKDSEGKHRGFGFVSFDDHDPVDKIIIEKNHTINGQVLDVKKALPKRRQANAYSPYGRGFGMMDAGSSGWYDPAAMDGYGYSMQRGGSRYYGGGGGAGGGGGGGPGYSGGGSAGGYYGGPMRPRRGGWHSDRSY